MNSKQTKLLERAITDLGFVNCATDRDSDKIRAVIDLLNEVADDD